MIGTEIEEVELVDTLMGKFLSGVVPTSDELNRAMELGLNLNVMKEAAVADGAIFEDEEYFDGFEEDTCLHTR